MTLTQPELRKAADRLIAAAGAPCQCEPVRNILGDNDIGAAYAVQNLITQDSLNRGRTIVGYKIGITSPARKATAAATSAGSPGRPSGTIAVPCSTTSKSRGGASPESKSVASSGVST